MRLEERIGDDNGICIWTGGGVLGTCFGVQIVLAWSLERVLLDRNVDI
jgi:hypothetical protein